MPPIVRAPGVEVSWSGAAETAVMVAAAWTLFARFAGGAGAATGARGVAFGRRVYGLALIPFGLAHLCYVEPTASLVPSWLPAHVLLAYATGVTFLAAGAAIVVGVCARLAAALSALQLALFTLLVWVPIIARGGADAFALAARRSCRRRSPSARGSSRSRTRIAARTSDARRDA